METRKISNKDYVKGGKALLYGIVEYSVNDYIHYRLIQEKFKCGHPYQEGTIAKANRMVDELVIFFNGEFATGMIGKSSETIFQEMEQHVNEQLTGWKKLNGIGVENKPRKRGRPRKS